jgi:hypothetical protein
MRGEEQGVCLQEGRENCNRGGKSDYPDFDAVIKRKTPRQARLRRVNLGVKQQVRITSFVFY